METKTLPPITVTALPGALSGRYETPGHVVVELVVPRPFPCNPVVWFYLGGEFMSRVDMPERFGPIPHNAKTMRVYTERFATNEQETK